MILAGVLLLAFYALIRGLMSALRCPCVRVR